VSDSSLSLCGFSVDHNTRSTSWTDPRPPIILPIPRPAMSPVGGDPSGGSAGANSAAAAALANGSGAEGAPNNNGGETNRIRTSYDGSHKQDLDWYRDVLQMSLVDKVGRSGSLRVRSPSLCIAAPTDALYFLSLQSLTPDEDKLLADVRTKLKITMEDHRSILKECGWTPEEFEGIRKEDPWRKECCLCLDAPATHIILDCFHLCLCEKCSVTLAKQELAPGKEKTCPKCRSVIRAIHKTY
jgi:hypothetical protein